MTTMIKFGNDNRHKPETGALQKWEDIVGIKSGTPVKIIKECHETNIVVVELTSGGTSPCGLKNYKPGTKRMVSIGSIDTKPAEQTIDIEAVIDITVANQNFNLYASKA